MISVNHTLDIDESVLTNTLKEFDKKYDEKEFAIGKMALLSTTPNSYGIVFTEEKLRTYGETAKGKFVVAYYDGYDVTDHDPSEWIVGYIPENQDFEFVKKEDGNVIMYACVLISKVYASEIIRLFEIENKRSVSVEVACDYTDKENGILEKFNIIGVTILGRDVPPSCPDAQMNIVRFSNKEVLEKLNEAFIKFTRGEKKMSEQIKKTDDSNITMANNEPKVGTKAEPKVSKLSDIVTSDFAKNCGLSDDYLDMSGDSFVQEFKKMSDDLTEMSDELETLRKFKADVEEEKRSEEVTKIVDMARGKVSDEDMTKIEEDSKTVSMEDMETFSNTVKAKMYDFSVANPQPKEKEEVNEEKVEKKEEVKKMSGTNIDNSVKKQYEDVWDRLRNDI